MTMGGASKGDAETLKANGNTLLSHFKGQWGGIQYKEEALKGDRQDFNCNEEALN